MTRIDAKYIRGEGRIEKAEYGDGSLALLFWQGDNRETLTVNLAGYGIVAPQGHVYVPDYGVGEGVPDALEQAGVAEYVEAQRVAFGGFDAGARLMKVVA